VHYFNYTLEMQASDPTAEWQLKLAALMKVTALQAGQLEPLVYETWIFDKHLDIKKSEVRLPEEYLTDFRAARKMVADMVKGDSVESFSDVLAIIQTNQANLLATDRTFSLETQLLKFAPAALEATVKQRLLDVLPSEAKQVTLKQALLQTQALKQSELMKKSTMASRGQVEAFEEAVHDMLRGISPDPEPAKSCTFYATVLRALQWFCEAQAGSKGQLKKLLRGAAALEHLYKEMDKTMAAAGAEGKPGLADLEVILWEKWWVGR